MLANNYDAIFFGIIIFSTIMALFRGAVNELLSLSVWFIAFTVMQHFGSNIDSRIPSSITNVLLRGIIVFVVAFILVAIIIAIIKKLCASIIKSIGLGGLNYLLGAVFGIIRGILVCAVLTLVIETLHFDGSHAWQNSRLGFILTPTVEWISKAIPEQIKELPKPPLGISG
jgi:membrane protein required for colicin V production